MLHLNTVVALVAAGTLVAGCSTSPSARIQSQTDQALYSTGKMVPGARVYAVDSIQIAHGHTLAVFPGYVKITITAAGVSIYNPETRDRFETEATAQINVVHGATSVLVPPGESLDAKYAGSSPHLVQVVQ